MDDYRESIWGIRPRDRGWFQLLTLIGGTSGSIILTVLELDSLASGTPAGEAARNLILGIGASFVASGFISWGVLQVKELPMLIADWIREATRKRRERWMEQGRQQGLEQGRQQGMEEGRLETLREIYGPDYPDSQENSLQTPDGKSDNGADGNNGRSSEN